MEENNFFKLVWRFNGLIISIAGLLAIAVLIFASYEIYKSVTRDRSTRNIVNVDEDEKIKEEWRYGQLTKISGTKSFMLALHSDQSFSRAYFSKSSNSTRNYLFINTETSEKKWLFEHTDYLIESTDRLRLGGYDSKEHVVAILYKLVKLDSDQNSRLTVKDLNTIAVTSADGSNYKELISDVELVVDHKLLNEKELLLIYQKNEISYLSIIELDQLEITKNEKLPNVGL
jgi:hypothetical protein